jgi:hypothetical protein
LVSETLLMNAIAKYKILYQTTILNKILESVLRHVEISRRLTPDFFILKRFLKIIALKRERDSAMIIYSRLFHKLKLLKHFRDRIRIKMKILLNNRSTNVGKD